jgi:hypothetical protein
LCVHTSRQQIPGQQPGWAGLDNHTIFMCFICNLLLFSMGQWENWLCGMGLCNVLPAMFLVAAIVAVRLRWSLRNKTAAAIVLCWAAMFSSGNGVLAWPVVGLLLTWSESWNELRAKRWVLVVFFGAFVLSCVLYAIGYQLPQRPLPGNGEQPRVNLLGMLHYIVIFLGNSVCVSSPLAPTTIMTISGTIMLLLFVCCAAYFVHLRLVNADPGACDRLVVWFALAGFSIGSGLIASLFRTQLGTGQGGSSRYVTFSIFLPIALVNLIPPICADLKERCAKRAAARADGGSLLPSRSPGRMWDQIPAALASAMILLQMLRLPTDLENFDELRINRRQAKAELLLVNVLPDAARMRRDICFEPSQVVTQSPLLSDMGYIHPPLIATGNVGAWLHEGHGGNRSASNDPGTYGKVERLLQPRPDQVTIVGWAAMPDESVPVHAVFVTCENEKGEPVVLALADLRSERMDIARQHDEVNFRWSGWSASIPVDRLPASKSIFKFSAWAMNVDAGRAFKIPGEISVSR